MGLFDGSFNNSSKKKKILGVLIICLIFGFVGLIIHGLLYLILGNAGTDAFFSIGALVGGGGSLLIGLAFVIFMFFRYHDKFGQKILPTKKDNDVDTSHSPGGIDRKIFESKISVLKDEIKTGYATGTVAGVEGHTNEKDKEVDDISYRFVAEDRGCLMSKFEKENKECKINGKPIMDISAGGGIIIGPQGSGKTWVIIKPTIFHLIEGRSGASMVVTDPKGELGNETSAFAKANGYEVLRFNTANYKASHSGNVLSDLGDLYYKEYFKSGKEKKELDGLKDLTDEQKKQKELLKEKIDDAKSEIAALLETLVQVICPDTKNTDPHGTNGARIGIKAFLEIFLDFGVKRSEYSLYNVFSNAIGGDDQDISLLKDQLPEGSIAKTEMQRMGAGASNDKEIGSFKTTAQVAMDSFLNINIRKITSTNNENEINFVNFIEKKTIIYLGLDMAGEDSSASNKLACLFMQLLYNELTKYLRKNNLESYEKPKLFIIDEFANIPKMPFIPKMYVLNRSNNIFALPVIQDINQLRKTYKDDYLTMLNNVSFTFITGNLGVDDAKYYCDKIGKNGRKRGSKSTNDEGKGSTSVSDNLEDIIQSNEFSNIAPEEMIVFIKDIDKPYKFKKKFFKLTNYYKNLKSEMNAFGAVNYGTVLDEEIDWLHRAENEDVFKQGVGIYAPINADKKRCSYAISIARQNEGDELIGNEEEDCAATKKYLNKMKNFKTLNGGFPCLALDIVNELNGGKNKVPETKQEEKSSYKNTKDFSGSTVDKPVSVKKVKKQKTIKEFNEGGYTQENIIKYYNNLKISSIKPYTPNCFLLLLSILKDHKQLQEYFGDDKYNEIIKSLSGIYLTYGNLYLDGYDGKISFASIKEKYNVVMKIEFSGENAGYLKILIDMLIKTHEAASISDPGETIANGFNFTDVEEFKEQYAYIEKWCENNLNANLYFKVL